MSSPTPTGLSTWDPKVAPAVGKWWPLEPRKTSRRTRRVTPVASSVRCCSAGGTRLCWRRRGGRRAAPEAKPHPRLIPAHYRGAMGALQSYTVTVDWTGATPAGTRSYRSYSRDHEIRIEGKPALLATSDRLVAADVSRYKAEELFVAAVSQAQMLWFLRTAARAGVVVTGYSDVATATERVEGAGSGPFVEVVLRPRVHFAEEVPERSE